MRIILMGIMSLLVVQAVAAEVPKTAKDDPYLLLELFGEAFKSAREEYVDETSDRKLIEAAINGMLSSLDPHSGFLDDETLLHCFNSMMITFLLPLSSMP